MKEINDGGPAFPVPGMQTEDEYGRKETISPRRGMSKRDYFAAKAMQAIIAGNGLGFMGRHPSGWDTNAGLVKSAYGIADAMIAEGSK